MQVHTIIQGSDAWHQYRKEHFNASDAPAMLGQSPYKSRNDLIAEYATGMSKEINAATQHIFDKGHLFESLSRPLMEDIVGEELYPVVGSNGKLSASFDGITLLEDVIAEHKSFNADIDAAQTVDDLGLHFKIQMEQQLYVSGASKCLFMATKWDSDNKLIIAKHFWYFPDLALRQQILDGWIQFDKDVAAYVPLIIAEKPVAEVIEQLPAVVINVTGELAMCNLDQVTPKFDLFLSSAKTVLKTDDDFVNAGETAKFSRETAKKLQAKAKEVIGQIASVNAVIIKLEFYEKKFDALGLTLEKLVKSEKDVRKLEITASRKQAFADHVAALEAEIKPIRLIVSTPDFAEAIKGKSSIKSFHSAADDALAKGKMEADAIAKGLRANLTYVKETHAGMGFLFQDLQHIIYKAPDDFQLLVNSRVADHVRAEEAKAEALRLKIQQEEEAKVAARTAAALQQIKDEAAAQMQAMQRESDEALRNAVAVSDQVKTVQQQISAASPIFDSLTKPAHVPLSTVLASTHQTAPQGAPDLRLGQIAERLGFALPADFLRVLGVEPAGRDRSAVLYHESDFRLICNLLINHIQAVAISKAA